VMARLRVSPNRKIQIRVFINNVDCFV
jgi:hypothetical protein